MDQFALRSAEDRRTFLQETAARLDLVEIIVEKDFWVCWTLKRLFSNPDLSAVLTFKGGTSLSKGYGIINRFSEDIDLTISRNAQFLSDCPDPTENAISKNEQKRRIDTLKLNAQRFVAEIALPTLEAAIQSALNASEGWSIKLDPEDPDQQTILFYYPQVFSYQKITGGPLNTAALNELALNEMSVEENYIRPRVTLEFGARGEPEPKDTCSISPIVAETFYDEFAEPSVEVSTLHIERTFWEKVTILHAIHHGANLRDRMSRHYYDTHMLGLSPKAGEAIRNRELLASVVRNKSLMFRDSKASYETAEFGTLKLVPNEEQIPTLRADYDRMRDMFMGEFPDFDEVLEGLRALQEKINNSVISSP